VWYGIPAGFRRILMEDNVVSYFCDRCGLPVLRCDLRSGTVEHLVDSSVTFELCLGCFVSLRSFLQGSEVPALMPTPARGQGSTEKS
jgi:hypothetical protein